MCVSSSLDFFFFEIRDFFCSLCDFDSRATEKLLFLLFVCVLISGLILS